jgi:AraC family transcriptional regulator, positive regulator of tynA and feaB
LQREEYSVVRAESSQLVRLSTRDVAPADRLSYASWILSSALAPSALSTGTPSEYELEVTALELPSIAIVAQSGSPQRSIRARPEIRRTSQRYFFLVLVLSGSWQVTNVSRTRFGPGDLIFYDSRCQLDCNILLHWSDVNLQLSEQFVRKWVPNPAVLGGRRICRDSQWGRVLASYVAQLSPDFVVQAPLPQAVLIDQLGALLALTASELSGSRAVSTPAERSVRDHVYDHITQRCPDSSLQAADVASSLNISKRTLHRALAAGGETFGAMLIQARLDLAVRMLQSPLFDRVTTAEIGRRAGFSDASHFVKVLRRHTGQTPLQMRRASHGKLIAQSTTSAD